MQSIEAILFEPVGCLAEFSPIPFLEIASRLYGRKSKTSQSGSRAYWHLLNLISTGENLEASSRELLQTFELQAVDGASMYEDVSPALSQLKQMGIRLVVASSLSTRAVTQFLNRHSLDDFFSEIWTRDTSAGVKSVPLQAALARQPLDPGRTMFLTDTLEGLKIAKAVGTHPILMMNDPDESRRLAMHNPSGGIVSLHELPDFIRLIVAENART